MATVELQFGALPAHVRTARLVAAALARRVGVEESLIDDVKLAVGEACSRAVDVHRRHDPAQLVTVRFDDSDDVYTISVLDTGPPLEQVAAAGDGGRPTAGELLQDVRSEAGTGPAALADPAGLAEADGSTAGNASDVGPGLPPGLGLALIEGLVDDVSIAARADGPGTRVSMSWPILGDLELTDAPDDLADL